MKFFKKTAKQPTGRQRILSGSDRGQVAPSMNYYAKRNPAPEPRGRKLTTETTKRHLRLAHSFWLPRFGLLILIIVSVVTLLSVLRLSSNPKVVILGSSNVALHSSQTYQQAAQKILQSSLLNGNKITVNSGAVAKELQAKYPELTSVSVTLPLFSHRPIVYVEPAQPSLLLATTYGNYIVDASGRVLAQDNAQKSVSALNLPHVTDQSGIRPVVGKQAMPATTVQFIHIVQTELAAKQIATSVMVLPPASSQLNVYISGVSYYVKFNLQSGTARKQSGTYLATRANLAGQGITPAEYIDVRVEGRAYFK